MKPLLLVLGLILAVIIFLCFANKSEDFRATADTDTRRPSQSTLPTQTKQNDKLVLVKGISQADLKHVLTGFCNMYNKENFQAQPRLTKLTEREFVITFPYNMDFEIFCYFINYIEYPMELTWSPNLTAWTTTKNSDTWITERSANKKAMLFIPTDDTEHDNVYMTTQDNIGYKLGFALGGEKQLLTFPGGTIR
jgi:hypothetical protein